MLEAEVIRRLVADLGSAEVKRLEQHVKQEEAALSDHGPLSIRLAGEFHILLADSRARRPWRALSARSSRVAR
ncbi:hypothetical protein D3C72_2231350 [compost metagenome]